MSDSEVKRQPVTRVTDPSELLRRSRLTPSEGRKEVQAERVAHDRREKEEWDRRIKQSEEKQIESEKTTKPWKHETGRHLCEPPDINYREMILNDQEQIDDLLEDESLHFSQRCLEYQTQDLELEVELLKEYDDWTMSMLSHAKEAGESKREEFFSKLKAVVNEDHGIVYNEWVSQYMFDAERGQWLQKIDLKATYLSCYCTGCTSDKNKTRHEELEREKVAAGREDFKNGIKDCECESCLTKRQAAEDRHEKLREKAKLSGNMSLKVGVPGCDCGDCEKLNEKRAQHKKLKHEERERGNTDFISEVPGCYCLECRLARHIAEEEATKALHEELKQKQVINGNTDFRAGVEGCNCDECDKAKEEAGYVHHKQLRREEWVRGNSYFEEPIPNCQCYYCKMDWTYPSSLEHDETTDDVDDTQPPPEVADEHSKNHHPTQPNSPNEARHAPAEPAASTPPSLHPPPTQQTSPPHKPRRSRIPVPVRHPISRKPQKPSRIPILIRRPVVVPAPAQAQAPAPAQERAQAQAQGEQQRRGLGRRMVDRMRRK